MSYKRKRSSASGYGLGYSPGGKLLSGPIRPPMKAKRRQFRVGRDRVGGFYGRFAGRGGELKFHDVDLDDAVVATAGTITATINIIPQGVTEVTRVGRKCTLRSIFWRYQISLPGQESGAGALPGDSIRMILFLDKQANGATAAVLDILETATFQSFRNLANQGRFNILCDKIYNPRYAGMASEGAGVVTQGLTTQNYTWYKKVDIPVEFSGTTGVIGEIRSNNLGVLLISPQGSVGFFSAFRLRFSDT